MVSRKEAESLKVTLEDFDHALNYDVKPAFGTSEDQLNHFVYNGTLPDLHRASLPIFFSLSYKKKFHCQLVLRL